MRASDEFAFEAESADYFGCAGEQGYDAWHFSEIPRRESLFDSLAAAIFDFIFGDIGAHQLEMDLAALSEGIDVFSYEVALSGACVELVFQFCFTRGGAGDWSGFLIERIVAAGFHLDRLVAAGDHWRR